MQLGADPLEVAFIELGYAGRCASNTLAQPAVLGEQIGQLDYLLG